VLVLTYLANPIAPLQVKPLEETARSLGVTLQVHDIRTADDLSAAFDTAAKEHAEALLTTAREYIRGATRAADRARGPLQLADDVLLFDARCRLR